METKQLQTIEFVNRFFFMFLNHFSKCIVKTSLKKKKANNNILSSN